MPRKPGRPTKLDDERVQAILRDIRQGNTLRVAAEGNGIGYSTFKEWRIKFPAFSAEVEKAEAIAEADHVRNIRTHSADNWQASAWWLERRRHDDWRKRETVNVGNDGDKPFRTASDDTEREAKLATLLARLGETGA